MTIATQATLAALLAKTLTAPATEAKQDTGNTSLATLVTNTAGLATATGQASQGTKLDTLHTDLTGPLTTQSRSTVVTASGSALNATLDGTTDTSGYSAVRVQMSGTYNATTSFEVSNDGTTWTGTYLYNPSNNGPTNQGGTSGTTGIAWALTGAFAATDTTAVAAGVQIDGTYV